MCFSSKLRFKLMTLRQDMKSWALLRLETGAKLVWFRESYFIIFFEQSLGEWFEVGHNRLWFVLCFRFSFRMDSAVNLCSDSEHENEYEYTDDSDSENDEMNLDLGFFSCKPDDSSACTSRFVLFPSRNLRTHLDLENGELWIALCCGILVWACISRYGPFNIPLFCFSFCGSVFYFNPKKKRPFSSCSSRCRW